MYEDGEWKIAHIVMPEAFLGPAPKPVEKVEKKFFVKQQIQNAVLT